MGVDAGTPGDVAEVAAKLSRAFVKLGEKCLGEAGKGAKDLTCEL